MNSEYFEEDYRRVVDGGGPTQLLWDSKVEIVRALPIAAQRYGKSPQATDLGHEVVPQARRSITWQLFLPASVEVLKQAQKMIWNGLFGDFVEHRAHLTTDMGLEVRGHAFSRRTLGSIGAVVPLHTLGSIYRHAPLGLLLVTTVHGGSFSALLPGLAV